MRRRAHLKSQVLSQRPGLGCAGRTLEPEPPGREICLVGKRRNQRFYRRRAGGGPGAGRGRAPVTSRAEADRAGCAGVRAVRPEPRLRVRAPTRWQAVGCGGASARPVPRRPRLPAQGRCPTRTLGRCPRARGLPGSAGPRGAPGCAPERPGPGSPSAPEPTPGPGFPRGVGAACGALPGPRSPGGGSPWPGPGSPAAAARLMRSCARPPAPRSAPTPGPPPTRRGRFGTVTLFCTEQGRGSAVGG